MARFLQTKQTAILISSAFLISVCTTACGSPVSSDLQSETPQSQSSISETLPFSTEYAPRDAFVPQGNLEYLAIDSYSDGFSSSDGFYRFVAREEGGTNLRYIDFASGQEVYLCSSPNCNHNDESCPSWFSNFFGRQLAIPVGNHLVLLHGSSIGMGSTIADQILPSIEIAQLDGSERSCIFTFPASSDLCSLIYDSCARDEQNLYFTVQNYSESETTRTLCALNANTGELISLCDLPEIEEKIIGVCGNDLIMSYVPYEYDFSADMEQLPLQFVRYNPSANEFTKLFELPYTQIGGCYDGKYYTLTADKTLCAYDLENGALLQEIFTTLPDNFTTSYSYRFDGIYDGAFYTHSYLNQGSDEASVLMYYALSLDTGEATENANHYTYSNGTSNPCAIVTTAGDYYLVIDGMRSINCKYPVDSEHDALWMFDIPQYRLVSHTAYQAGSVDGQSIKEL